MGLKDILKGKSCETFSNWTAVMTYEGEERRGKGHRRGEDIDALRKLILEIAGDVTSTTMKRTRLNMYAWVISAVLLGNSTNIAEFTGFINPDRGQITSDKEFNDLVIRMNRMEVRYDDEIKSGNVRLESLERFRDNLMYINHKSYNSTPGASSGMFIKEEQAGK